MNARLTLAITGRIGPYTVLADEALEHLADKLRATESPSCTILLPNGDRETARIAAGSVTLLKLGDNRQALVADVELPDTVGGELPPLLTEAPPPASAAEVTEAERAEQMPVLEAQIQSAQLGDGEPE